MVLKWQDFEVSKNTPFLEIRVNVTCFAKFYWVGLNAYYLFMMYLVFIKCIYITGPMPLMANLMLSTRRPIVNHPHYEDVSLRHKTRKVYQMYSRRSPEEYQQTLKAENIKSAHC